MGAVPETRERRRASPDRIGRRALQVAFQDSVPRFRGCAARPPAQGRPAGSDFPVRGADQPPPGMLPGTLGG